MYDDDDIEFEDSTISFNNDDTKPAILKPPHLVRTLRAYKDDDDKPDSKASTIQPSSSSTGGGGSKRKGRRKSTHVPKAFAADEDEIVFEDNDNSARSLTNRNMIRQVATLKTIINYAMEDYFDQKPIVYRNPLSAARMIETYEQGKTKINDSN